MMLVYIADLCSIELIRREVHVRFYTKTGFYAPKCPQWTPRSVSTQYMQVSTTHTHQGSINAKRTVNSVYQEKEGTGHDKILFVFAYYAFFSLLEKRFV